jgi:hypothetical protein
MLPDGSIFGRALIGGKIGNPFVSVLVVGASQPEKQQLRSLQ